MRYLETDEAIKYEDEEFSECRAVKLHYVIYGRNAWNSTWVTKYSPGCMNLSFDTAKRVAEKNRIQGSVFYIRELPALQFINSKLSLFVTEINTDIPLKYHNDLSDETSTTLMDVYKQFDTDKPNSIIRLIGHNTEYSRQSGKIALNRNDFNNLEQISSTHSFKGYKSFSHGKGYLLGWNNHENKAISTSVLLLEQKFNILIESNNSYVNFD